MNIMLTSLLKNLSKSNNLKKVRIWVLSTMLIFAGFYTNAWRVAEQNWFKNHQRDTEGHIMGRMVKSRQDGILSAGGLNGDGLVTIVENDTGTTKKVVNQYIAYFNGHTFDTFSTYNSQPGGQGMIFSLIEKIIPFSPIVKLWIFWGLTSLFSALAITYVIGWFYEEFGGWVGLCVLCSVILSQWLTVFGRNLWWSLWAFYLPMIVVLYHLKRHRNSENLQFVKFGILIFIAVSIKCFINGYEYITTTLIMMVAPCIYYAILDKWNRDQCLKFSFATAVGTGVAILLSLIMLCYQIGAVKGGFMDGIEHVIWSFGKRTYGEAEDFPPVYAASLEAGAIGVVITYMNGVFFDFNNYLSQTNAFVINHLFKIRYYYLIVLFLAISVLLFVQIKRVKEELSQKYKALFWTTWFSILAPISWFVIFKAHSYIHTHMSFLLWQMPFTIFGFALFGVAVITWKKINVVQKH